MMIFRSKSSAHAPDYFFISLLAALVVGGIIFLSSASSDLGKIKFDDTYYYVKHQIKSGFIPGIIGFFAGFFIYYGHWRRWAFLLLIASLVLLPLVFTAWGYRHGGASRWIEIGGFSFQPSEIVKLTFIIYVAAWLTADKGQTRLLRKKNLIKGYLPFITVTLLVVGLIIAQRSTTNAIIILLAGILMYFIGGARFSYIAITVVACIALLTIVISLTPYRLERILNFLNLRSNPDVSKIESGGYQINQALIAIGSGGLYGVGLGKSTSKFNFLPEPIGDSIFAVIAEETGFAGAAVLLAVFAGLFMRGFYIARRSEEQFGKLLIIGFTSVMAIQSFIHIAANSGLVPLTGVPLPFISYGGTSLTIFLTMSGVIANISKYTA